jgi:predicted MFS family arabinose efflux permease
VRVLLILMLAFEALGVVACADLARHFWWAVLGLGVAGGLFGPTSTLAYPRLFGRRHLGAIVGVEMMSLVVASALGPSLLAGSKSLFASYAPALYASLVLPAVAAGLVLVFRPPAGATA